MQPKSMGLVALVALPLLVLGSVVSIILLLAPSKPAVADCGPVSAAMGSGTAVAGLSAEQLRNAAAVVDAGKALNLSVKGQTISLMVALGESGLRILDYGDKAGPDSRGLFQQRGNGAWGSYADRMNPRVSATNFIKALQAVPNWESLEPTLAGNKVQRNADPYHYRPYWDQAVSIVQKLSGGTVATGNNACGISATAGIGDDYPWKDSPTWVLAANTASAISPLGMFNRECVDFALWRVNQQMGSTKTPFKFLNSTFRPDGAVLGSALTWKAGWEAKGWPTGTKPKAGAVVWYAPGAGGADATYGHVAVVKEVKADGTYVEEGYNGNPAPNDHTYYTRTVKNTTPSAFLYLPNHEEKK